MSFGLNKEQAKRVEEVLKAHAEIAKVIVFGSRAKDTHHPGSDIDLALFGEEISHKEFLRLKSDLNKLNLPYKFDVVLYSEISEELLKKHIDHIGSIFFEREKNQV